MWAVCKLNMCCRTHGPPSVEGNTPCLATNLLEAPRHAETEGTPPIYEIKCSAVPFSVCSSCNIGEIRKNMKALFKNATGLIQQMKSLNVRKIGVTATTDHWTGHKRGFIHCCYFMPKVIYLGSVCSCLKQLWLVWEHNNTSSIETKGVLYNRDRYEAKWFQRLVKSGLCPSQWTSMNKITATKPIS